MWNQNFSSFNWASLFSLHSSFSRTTTMWPNMVKRALTRPVSWTSSLTLQREQILKTPLPQSESIKFLGPENKSEKGAWEIRLYLLWWLHNVRHMPHWPSRHTLYVTMSQACRRPAGPDLMDLNNPPLRDPYITCRYRRHIHLSSPRLPHDIYFSSSWGFNQGWDETVDTSFACWSEGNEINLDLFWRKEKQLKEVVFLQS